MVVEITDGQLDETIHALETRSIHVDSLEWMCLFALRELRESRKVIKAYREDRLYDADKILEEVYGKVAK